MKKILIAVIASLFVSVGFAVKIHAQVPPEPINLAEVETEDITGVSVPSTVSTYHGHEVLARGPPWKPYVLVTGGWSSEEE
jgi:hypothetical protein